MYNALANRFFVPWCCQRFNHQCHNGSRTQSDRESLYCILTNKYIDFFKKKNISREKKQRLLLDFLC